MAFQNGLSFCVSAVVATSHHRSLGDVENEKMRREREREREKKKKKVRQGDGNGDGDNEHAIQVKRHKASAL